MYVYTIDLPEHNSASLCNASCVYVVNKYEYECLRSLPQEGGARTLSNRYVIIRNVSRDS
jgi:hypothetical protein